MLDLLAEDIQIVDAADDARMLQAAYRLRYAVTVDELHKEEAHADHLQRELRDECDNEHSTVLCAVLEGAVIGTIRITWGHPDLPAHFRQQYALSAFGRFPPSSWSFTSRLAIDRFFRNGAAIGRLFDHAYRLVRERSGRVNFCQCTPALVRLYEQLGYRRYTQAVIDPDSGFHIPMVLLAEDADHLARVRSPLLRIARALPNRPETDGWFARQFPEFSHGGVHAGLVDEEFTRALAQEMYATDIALFRGLPAAAAEKFIAASRVVKVPAGELVVRQGVLGHEMYLILNGAAEVRRSAGGQPCTIATLGKGQIFGEMAFVTRRARTASVLALTDLEVLVLSQQFIQGLTKTMPATVIQILLNLSVILCDRLNFCTEQLLTYRHAPD